MIIEIKPNEYINTDHIIYFKRSMDIKHGFNNTTTEHWNVYVDLVGRGVTINFDQDEAEANVLIRKLLKSCND